MLLRNNRNLEDLAAAVDKLTLEDVEQFKFKLKKLLIRHSVYGPPSQEIVKSFLETQAETLKSLEIHVGLNRESLQCILNMPRLTSLSATLDKIEEAMMDQAHPFPANTTIKSLEIEFGDKEISSFAILVKALTSLKHFKCNTTDKLVLQILAREVPDLESLETLSFWMSHLPEGVIFPNMTSFKFESFFVHLQKPIGDDNFSILVRAEMENFFEME